jgi:hypothetical protein
LLGASGPTATDRREDRLVEVSGRELAQLPFDLLDHLLRFGRLAEKDGDRAGKRPTKFLLLERSDQALVAGPGDLGWQSIEVPAVPTIEPAPATSKSQGLVA